MRHCFPAENTELVLGVAKDTHAHCPLLFRCSAVLSPPQLDLSIVELTASSLLPSLVVALASSVEAERAHQSDPGEEDQTGRSDFGDIALVSDFREPSRARQLLLR
jgi:hypothetical protein